MSDPITPAVSVRVIEVNVNCGDHAQDMSRTVEVRPDETLIDAARRLLSARGYVGDVFDYANRLEIQLVEPITIPDQF